MITYTIDNVLREQGIQAAANAYNAANPDQWLTAEQYMQMVVNSAALSYATQYKVGIVSSGDYVLRFTPTENANITAAANTDATIAALLARVRESAEVVLYAPEVTQGVEYLVAQNLLTQARAEEILSYAVAIDPAEPVPEPEPEPLPEPEAEPEPEPEPEHPLP